MNADPRIQIAYESARGEVVRQMESVDELRSRVGTLLSAVTVASGFLAAQTASARDGLPWTGWLGTSATVAVIVLSIYVLWPRTWKGVGIEIDRMMSAIRNAPEQTLDEYLEELVGFTSGHVSKNRKKLSWMYTAFNTALVCIGISLVSWIFAVSTR